MIPISGFVRKNILVNSWPIDLYQWKSYARFFIIQIKKGKMFNFDNFSQGAEMPFFQWQPNYYLSMNHQENQREKTIRTLQTCVVHLTEELNSMKRILSQVVSQLQEKSSSSNQRAVSAQHGINVSDSRKSLLKHLVCPHEGCGRRYSSKIALNCHLRLKHEGNRP